MIAVGIVSWALLVAASLWLAIASYRSGFAAGERVGAAEGFLEGRRSEREESR
jgi:hypothetical protein